MLNEVKHLSASGGGETLRYAQGDTVTALIS